MHKVTCPPTNLIYMSAKQICLILISEAQSGATAPKIHWFFTIRIGCWCFCIIKKYTAASSVSWAADACYSIPDRLTDGGQNRLTATCLFSSFLGFKLLYKRCLLSTSYRWGFRPSCLICRKLPCDRFEVITSCTQSLQNRKKRAVELVPGGHMHFYVTTFWYFYTMRTSESEIMFFCVPQFGIVRCKWVFTPSWSLKSRKWTKMCALHITDVICSDWNINRRPLMQRC